MRRSEPPVQQSRGGSSRRSRPGRSGAEGCARVVNLQKLVEAADLEHLSNLIGERAQHQLGVLAFRDFAVRRITRSPALLMIGELAIIARSVSSSALRTASSNATALDPLSTDKTLSLLSVVKSIVFLSCGCFR